jgi:hypothetical protein
MLRLVFDYNLGVRFVMDFDLKEEVRMKKEDEGDKGEDEEEKGGKP